jgi:anti-anti-sigma regulatory factor
MPPHTDIQDSSLAHPAKTSAAVVSVVGEQDLARREWLSGELHNALDTGQPVVLDLSQATLIDSVSIAAILQAADRASARSQRFTICAPIGTLPRQVLSLLHVSSRAYVADSLEEAFGHTRADSAAVTEASSRIGQP